MSRATANLLLGVLIGGCVVVVATKIRKVQLEKDPDAIQKRLARRMKTLESRVQTAPPARAVTG